MEEQNESVLIIGIHSILEAVKNPDRTNKEIYCTEDAYHEFLRKMPDIQKRAKVQRLTLHHLHEFAQKIYKEKDHEYTRIRSGAFLLTSPLPPIDPQQIYDLCKGRTTKIVCLDQVTDAHNAAAIMRTCAFFGVHALVTSAKGGFGESPQFTRISSGALEHVKICRCSSLPKFLRRLQDLGVLTVGFSEHEKSEYPTSQPGQSICLVLGAEDTGLSHAVTQSLTSIVALKSKGEIHSLNVSVASALAMENFF